MPEIQDEVAALIAARNTWWDTDIEQAIVTLEQARKDIIARMAASRGYELLHLVQMRKEVDRIMDEAFKELQKRMRANVQRSVAMSGEFADDILGRTGAGVVLPALDTGLVKIFSDYTADLLSGITEDGKKAIWQQMLLGLIEGKSPTQIMDAIGTELLKPGVELEPSVFKNLEYRTEMLFRTESKRAFDLRMSEIADKLAEDIPDMQWMFITAEDGLVCDECGPLNGKVYDNYGDVELPVHPNCRCDMIPYMEGWYPELENQQRGDAE